MEIAPLTRALLTVGMPADKMETPAALSNIRVEEMAEVLNGLAAYASIQLTAPFREAYYRNHERESARFENGEVVQHQAIPSFQRNQ